MAVIEINENNFKTEVVDSKIPVLVDFNADWCGPCQALKPIIEELAETHPEFKFVSVNVDNLYELAESHNISSIPCLVVYKGGKEVNRRIGLVSADIVLNLLA